MKMEVVLVTLFAGLNGQLGRSGIASVFASTEEELIHKIRRGDYVTVQEFTPGAIRAGEAIDIASAEANVSGLPVYLDGMFEVSRIG